MRGPMNCTLATLVSLVAAGPVLAGDASELHVLGFAQAGKVFAFEEYGVQDGSGFPYANRFYIDTGSDQFLPGSPIRARIDDDSADVSKAREKAAADGEKVVAATEFKPGYLAAFNAITEQSANRFKIVAMPRPVFPTGDKSVGLRLEEIDIPGPADCAAQGTIKGFKLVRFDPETNADITVLHEDKTVPASRNCPLGYSLGGLQTDTENGAMAVLISVQSVGFEGPNHRWLAVTGKL